MKFVGTAVKFVGSGLGDYVHVRARARSKLGRRNVGLDLKLLNGINRRLNAIRFEERFVVIDAVERIVVGLKTETANGDRGAGRLKRGRAGANGAGHQQRELRETTTVQWQLHHLLVVDCGGNRRRVRLKLSGNSTNLHPLCDLAHFQNDIDTGRLVDVQLDVALNVCPESWHFRLDGVNTGRQCRHGIRSPGADHYFTFSGRSFIRDPHRHSGNCGSRFIRDISNHGPERCLCAHGPCKRCHSQRNC